MSGHNLTMKFPPDFHNYTGLNGLGNCSPNLPFLHKTNLFSVAKLNDLQKGKKQHHVRSGCYDLFCKKAFLKISQNSQRNNCAAVSF